MDLDAKLYLHEYLWVLKRQNVMQRIVQYVAKDGTPFKTPDECAEHDRLSGFREELFKFLLENFAAADQEDFNKMDHLWSVIYQKPEAFQPVLDAATPKPRRGRPRKQQEKLKPILKDCTITVANTKVIESNTEQTNVNPKLRRAILPSALLPSTWRSED